MQKNMHLYAKYVSMKFMCIICTPTLLMIVSTSIKLNKYQLVSSWLSLHSVKKPPTRVTLQEKWCFGCLWSDLDLGLPELTTSSLRQIHWQVKLKMQPVDFSNPKY